MPATPLTGDMIFVRIEIQLSLFKVGLGGKDRSFVGLVGLNGVVQFLLTHRSLLGKRRVSRHIEPGFLIGGFCAGQFPFHLIERGLVAAGIDLEQQIACFDERALLVMTG